ncbi:hypothetical protein HPB47_013388 [Ixodes persulcatus]|uniref:Uncharacterized protein n=1 Tax=Ixodes persulcatus TaxID=34615 RepID=A0AC60QYT5_IXOPE|nr:hypothetical protein HPB47_013388 [Ixodes persulcatus]
MPAFTADEGENQNMALIMTTQANQANQVQVTTLPDLSTSLWEDPTLLAIAQGKQRGVATNWHVSTGRQLSTCTIWKAGLKEQFALAQQPGDSLQQHAFAKFKILSRCPVPITDKERIEYLVQGIRDDQIATSIAVHRPRTVDGFLKIVSEINRTIDHSRLALTPTFPKPARDGRLSASGSTAHFNCAPSISQTGHMRIADMHPDEQEASGSSITVITASLVNELALLPWTKPALLVVGGAFLTPKIVVLLLIALGPMSVTAEAAFDPPHSTAKPLQNKDESHEDAPLWKTRPDPGRSLELSPPELGPLGTRSKHQTTFSMPSLVPAFK